MTLRLAIAGFGKIATTRHVPAIAEVGGVELVAIADPLAKSADVPHFPSLDRLLKEGPDIDAVTLCTPPQVRGAQALLALEARKHVMLEKPPGATVSEIAPLVAAAGTARRTLFATWHSRFAPAGRACARASRGPQAQIGGDHLEGRCAGLAPRPGLDLRSRRFRRVRSRHQRALDPEPHPARPVFVTRAGLGVPANREAPIVVDMDMRDATGLPIKAVFDFRPTGPHTWDIRIETDRGPLICRLAARR